MGIMDNETFLPGVITEVESDYSYGYDSSQFGSTDSTVIVGTAFSGPSGVAVEVYSPEHARYLFGETFDPITKKEATLVAGIEDAYQRGNRTIYAVRVGGKNVEKDYEFNTDTTLKLRVRAAYPTNQAKDFFLVYDNTEGAEQIKVYKPAERATIVEKMQGAVESSNAVIVLSMKLGQDHGLTKDSLLTEVIEVVNSHPYNNVIRLGIVNEEGYDVTTSDMDARTLPLGILFPGAYLIGRDQNYLTPDTELKYRVVADGRKPYEAFEGLVYKDLVYNTDLSNSLPIFVKDNKQFAEDLKQVEIFSSKHFDFLEVSGLIDRAFGKDKNDYEEVGLSKFDIYSRLGSGFAITAKAESRGDDRAPRIKETPVSDVNRVAEIKDGIYSMLENLNAKYRVLTCGNADDKIGGKLPRAKDFLVSTPVSKEILNGLIKATPIVNVNDHTDAKNYQFSIKHFESEGLAGSISEILTDVVLPSISEYKEDPAKKAPVLANGTVVAKTETVDIVDPASGAVTGTETGVKIYYAFNGGLIEKVNFGETLGSDDAFIVIEEKIYVRKAGSQVFVLATMADLNAAPGFDTQKYVLTQNNSRIFISELDIDAGTSEFADPARHLAPKGDIETMFSENEDETIVFSQSNYFEVNNIDIQSGMLDAITLEEFVDVLNGHHSLKHLFKFEVAVDGLIYKDDYVTEIEINGVEIGPLLIAGVVDVLEEDRVSAYDYNKYVPYKTSDNFARQLAQHCTYTSLKTTPSHGIMGVNLLNNTTLNGIAARVDELMSYEFDLYAKTPQGRNMLDRNNMPYPLGKNLSITSMQYPVYMDNGYTYRSNGATGYAGMISVLPLDQSSTNQPISLGEIAFELTNYQLTRLTQKGYVTIKNSYTKGFVITDGITFAPAESPFRRLNVSRISNAVEELIREAAEPFIGKQNHDANRNSLQTAIRSNLNKIKGTLIEAYEFNMVVDPAVLKFAYIDIDYNIVPIYEIREVRNRIKVKDQL